MWHFNHLLLRESLSKYWSFTLKCQKQSFTSSSVTFEEYQTLKTVKEKLMKALETDHKYIADPKPRHHLMQYMPKAQTDLPLRKMKDSFDSAVVPLSTDEVKRDKYTTYQGTVRLGRLMEDIDLFAGHIVYKHILIPGIPPGIRTPHVVVTISVSDIFFSEDIKPLADIRLSGHVCWVGKSSLEVVIYLDQLQNGKWQRLTRALLLMGARNPAHTGPGIVNAIEAETPEEKSLLQGGEQRKLKRMQLMNQSLLKTTPTEEELKLIHDLFLETIDTKDIILDKRNLPMNSKWMQDSTLNNLVFCHPEHRNLHNKIFGGFLIRQALELSWTAAYLYGMRPPKLVHISDVGFFNPVDVGSLLKLYGSVTFTENEYIQVYVFAEALSLSKIKSTTSFNFTYSLSKPCDKIYPLTYLEGIKYIDGRRRLRDLQQQFKKNAPS